MSNSRLIVLVSGAPGAGKTTLATAVAANLSLPLICKDDIKETLVDALDGPASDFAWSRQIGSASMMVLWRLAHRCPAAVLEANFRPHNPYEHQQIRQLHARIIELHCVCPAGELTRRFALRARTAHAAHPLTALNADLLAEYDQPMGVGELIEVDTSGPVDMARLVKRLRTAIDTTPPEAHMSTSSDDTAGYDTDRTRHRRAGCVPAGGAVLLPRAALHHHTPESGSSR